MVPNSKKRDKHTTTTVEQGISEQFDPTVLFFCLLYSGTNLLLPGTRKKELRVPPFYESERVDQLREQRNAVAHATTPSLSEADFQAKIREIEDIYTQLQWDQTQLMEAAYGRIWPVEHDRLQGKIDVEKARIDNHEQRLRDLEQQSQPQPQQDRETFVKTVEDTITKQIRQKYCNSYLPVQYSLDAPTRAPLDDMFVDLRLQKFETRKLPETLPYSDVEEMQRCKQSSEVIQIPQLFDVLEDKVAPHNVLIRGKAGVGKTTFVKQMSKQWAEKKLWNDIKYLFVVTLRELPQDRKWTLADLLLGELTLSEEEKTVAINEICKHPEDTMVAIEGLDEFPEYKFSEKRGGVRNEEVDLNVLISGIISGVMLPGAKVLVTSRPTDQLPSEVCHRVTEIYGFSKENIEKYVDKFSGGDSKLQLFIRRFLDTNVNIATMCYIPIQCNFVCMCLRDMHSCKLTGDVAAVSTITQLYVFATLHLIRKLHPALKNESKQMDAEAIFNKVGDSLKKHVKCLGSADNRCIARAHWQPDPHKFIKKLAPKIDPLKLTILVHEAQLPKLVDIIPATIESDPVFHTEMRSLSRALQQQKYRIIKLKVRNCPLSDVCRHQLKEEFGKERFYWGHSASHSDEERIFLVSDQMMVIYKKLRITEIETRLRFFVCSSLEGALKGLLHQSIITPFGSSINSFGRFDCDLDMVLELESEEPKEGNTREGSTYFLSKLRLENERQHTQQCLDTIAGILRHFMPHFQHVCRILNARVPIVKFRHAGCEVECDLCLSNRSALYMSELLYTYGQLDPRVCPLVFTIRHWARANQITHSGPGPWISNFTLTLLVLHHLQTTGVVPPLNTLRSLADPTEQKAVNDIDCSFTRDVTRVPAGRNTQSLGPFILSLL
ncbi:hypothetical protein LSAT2_016949 [Lamellibrachia satsuma]|nr:hypothetical protein LSAT2_016949 [Lamellibrachia satsuma]